MSGQGLGVPEGGRAPRECRVMHIDELQPRGAYKYDPSPQVGTKVFSQNFKLIISDSKTLDSAIPIARTKLLKSEFSENMGVQSTARAAPRSASMNPGSDKAVVADALTPGAFLTPGEASRGNEVGQPLQERSGEETAQEILVAENEAGTGLESVITMPNLSKDVVNQILKSTNVPPPAISVSDDLEEERAHIWAKILEAQSAGDIILTKHLMIVWSSLDEAKKKPPIARAVSATPVLLTVESRMVSKSVKAEKEHGLVYAIGAVSSHQDAGFTPYFEENIKCLKAPLPLTIFNNDWKKRAIRAHINLRQARPGDNDKAYRGLAYPSEWSQTHSDWTKNHRNFYLTLRDIFDKGLFAAKLLLHKENCDAIASSGHGFMTAFRYDMAVRETAFAHRIASEDGSAVQEISVHQTLLMQSCYTTAMSFGEVTWTENKYAPGQEFSHIDPEIGVTASLSAHAQSFPFDPVDTYGRRHTAMYGAVQHYQHNPGSFYSSPQYPSNSVGYPGPRRQPSYPPPGNSMGEGSRFFKDQSGHQRPFESKKRSRGYHGANFVEGFVDRRQGRNVPHAHPGGPPAQGKK
ncbi:hypothetical protein PTTG_11663 [Puccinia triticina 1-1 BBBD Race 1]|uniref:Uncharacterized protein n=1 Tax=Puccinia triticina (isolate 1-1 / race 1 (BBBD)) TaxID=630390 RepID=A0A180GYU5_PUCT1|nr:hypothetical protein PTTG_11663 [Puccinia triticina 1-1 BBBD Race 1]